MIIFRIQFLWFKKYYIFDFDLAEYIDINFQSFFTLKLKRHVLSEHIYQLTISIILIFVILLQSLDSIEISVAGGRPRRFSAGYIPTNLKNYTYDNVQGVVPTSAADASR